MTSYFFVVDSAKGSIPPKTMIVSSKQCHDLRMLASQAEPGQSKRMERTPQPRVSLIHLSLEPACQKLSLVDGTYDHAEAECYHCRENLLHDSDANHTDSARPLS